MARLRRKASAKNTGVVDEIAFDHDLDSATDLAATDDDRSACVDLDDDGVVIDLTKLEGAGLDDLDVLDPRVDTLSATDADVLAKLLSDEEFVVSVDPDRPQIKQANQGETQLASDTTHDDVAGHDLDADEIEADDLDALLADLDAEIDTDEDSATVWGLDSDADEGLVDPLADRPQGPAEEARAFEALLMVAEDPLPTTVVADVLGTSEARVTELAEELQAFYESSERGFVLRRIAGGYRIQSHPDLAGYIEKMVLEGQTAKLSGAALESLAIVAYKQPVSRAQIAAIRGVNVDAVMRTLTQRGYVAELGRDGGPGQAVLYGTTPLFLENLGLDSLDDLPPIADFVPDTQLVEALERGLSAGEHDPRTMRQALGETDNAEGFSDNLAERSLTGDVAAVNGDAEGDSEPV
jgi:segregation and condensation protein B